MKIVPVVIGAVAAVTIISCSSTASPHPTAGGSSSAPSPTAVATTSPASDCLASMQDWKTRPGFKSIPTIGKALGRVAKDSRTLNVSEMRIDLTLASIGAGIVLEDPPPACIPGFRPWLLVAMNDIVAADKALHRGGISGVNRAGTLISEAGAALRRSGRAFNRWFSLQP